MAHSSTLGTWPNWDINGAICEQMNIGEPHCLGIDPPRENVPSKYPRLTLNMANQFLHTMLRVARDRQFVDPDEAERRMELCRGCPIATSLGVCPGCNGLMTTVLGLIKGSAPTPAVGKAWCGACGCYTPFKVLIPNEIMDKAEAVRPDYWEGCWRHSSSPNV